jgi:hypothetical protein
VQGRRFDAAGDRQADGDLALGGMSKQSRQSEDKVVGLIGLSLVLVCIEAWQWIKYFDGHGFFSYVLRSDTAILFKVLIIGIPHALMGWGIWRYLRGSD